MKIWRAEIGIALVAAYTVPASVYWIGIFLRLWYGNPFFALFANRIIMLVLCVVTVLGFVIYVLDRKVFLNRAKSKKIASQPLVILSLVLVMEGVFFGCLTGFGPEGYMVTWNDLGDFSLYTVWYLVRVISGLIFLIDGFIIITRKRVRDYSKSWIFMLTILGAALNAASISGMPFRAESWSDISRVHHGKYFWDSPSSHCPRPYMAGYMDTDGFFFGGVEKTRVTVSFPDTNASVIQEDNWLAGGMFVVGYDKALVQIDYGFYSMLRMDHGGDLYLDVGIVETYECLPYWPYICPFGIYPWAQELYSHTVLVEGVPPSTPITLVASWDPSRSGWVQWNYTVNSMTCPAGAVNVTALAPTVIRYFYVGSRDLTFNWFIGWIPYWQTYPFQFGVMSSYNIGHGGWNVFLSNLAYFREGEWHNVEAAKSIGGINAMLDTRWMWGGENYDGVNADYYPSLEAGSVKFYYSGSTIRDHTVLWRGQPH
ncbi:MAG: hypothetical protein OEY88_07945 [Candidatus Bathyarchaeota archaeon]|nr:hypothetical protein [Candidatus Bathyarchaeota archaeon]